MFCLLMNTLINIQCLLLGIYQQLERLMELADPDTPEGRLVMAEGARELGRFEEALATLARPFPARYQGSAEVLRPLAGAGDSRVRLLDENNPAD